MKNFTTIFLSIIFTVIISALPFTTFAETSYPVERYFVYVQQYVSEGVYTEVNVTSQVSLNGLTLTLPYSSDVNNRIRVILTSLPASNSQPINQNVYSISGSLTLSWVNPQQWLPNTFTGSVENQKFKSTLPNPQYPDAGVNYEVDGVASLTNSQPFSIAPNTQLSARLVFYLDLTYLSGAPVITFDYLYINDVSILDKVYVDNVVNEFTDIQSSDMASLSELPTPNSQVFDDLSSDFEDIAVSFLDDGTQYYRLMISPFESNPLIIAILTIVSVCAVISYIVFGKAG